MIVSGFKTLGSSSVETTEEICPSRDVVVVAVRAKSVFIRASNILISASTFRKYKRNL